VVRREGFSNGVLGLGVRVLAFLGFCNLLTHFTVNL